MSNTLPGEGSDDDKVVLHGEFRALTTLITVLLKLLRGNGQLPPDLHNVDRTPRQNGRYTQRVLSAVSDVLVRRFEVAAVANYKDTETISTMSTDEEGSAKFTDFVEPKESSSYHMGIRNWLAWISDVSKRYFTSMVAVVNPNDEILGSISSGESNAIEVVKTAAAPSLFGIHVDPYKYYITE
jgi:hypothetical protein